MKKVIRDLQNTVILLMKLFLYIMIIGTFFLIFSIENWQILRFSRTAGVTLVTFVVVGLAMMAAYGGYDVGKRKSKPIIYSISLATVITDCVTYFQLSIMNVNAANNATLKLENIGLLILTMVIQILLIVVMTYFGNYVYFRINRPERCCIITSSQKSLNNVMAGVGKFRKQYKVCDIIDCHSSEIYKTIMKNDTVFLYDVPVELRKKLIEYCYRNNKNIYFNPEIADIVEMNAEHVVLDDVSLVGAPAHELSLEQRFLKRMMDLIISGLAMIITSPIWLVCAISIKAYDGGKVFFKQDRATKNGKIFQVYKFRTMRENVNNYSSVKDDDRITPVGKILRKIRIDELPQLLNILKGDMSLVGPRPEMLENVYSYTKELPEFEYRLRVKAGLTGYAQIAGKYNTSPRDKLILDLMYIEKYSIWRDIKLLFQTLIVFFKSDSTEAFGEENGAKFVENFDDKK